MPLQVELGQKGTEAVPQVDPFQTKASNVPDGPAQGRRRLLALCFEVAPPTTHSRPAAGAPHLAGFGATGMTVHKARGIVRALFPHL